MYELTAVTDSLHTTITLHDRNLPVCRVTVWNDHPQSDEIAFLLGLGKNEEALSLALGIPLEKIK